MDGEALLLKGYDDAVEMKSYAWYLLNNHTDSDQLFLKSVSIKQDLLLSTRLMEACKWELLITPICSHLSVKPFLPNWLRSREMQIP